MDDQVESVTKEILANKYVDRQGEKLGTALYFLEGAKPITFAWEDHNHETEKKFVWMPTEICQEYLDATFEKKKAIFAEPIIPIKDIELVIKQADVSFTRALDALVVEKGDIVNAIMLLQAYK